MARFTVRPICAAIMLLSAHSAHVAAQDSGTSAPAPAGGPATSNEGPVQQVRITGLRQSIRSAEQIKRDAAQVVDSINADDIGKFPDRAAGDALQRIAGVQVGRDRGETNTVIIRGLPDVATTFDGNEIFTGTGRRLSYQDLPVLSIGGMDVYKSIIATQLEGGIAGAINVRLRQPFDFREPQTLTGHIENRRSVAQGSAATDTRNAPGGSVLYSRRWNSTVGEMGVVFDVAYNKDYWGYPVQWNDRPDRLFSVSPDGTATRLNDDQPIAPLRPGDRLANLPHIGGIYNAGERSRGSVHGAYQWKINPKLEFTTQYLGMGYRGEHEVDYIIGTVGWTPRLTNVVLPQEEEWCRTPNGMICPITSATAPAAKFNVGPYDYDPYMATSTWGVKERTDSHYLNFALQYRDGPWNVTNSLAYTRSKFIEDRLIVDQQIPGATASVFTYGSDGHGGYSGVTTPTSANPFRDPNEFVLRGMVQNWGESRGEQWQWRTDATYRLDAGIVTALNAGVRLSSREATFHSGEGNRDLPAGLRPSPVAAFGPDFNKLVPGVDRLGGPWVTPSRDFLLDNADTVRRFYGMAPGRIAEDPNRMFDQREKSATLYLNARWKTEIGGIGIDGNAGVRAVRVNRDLRGSSRIGDVVSPIDLSTSETNVLPSASAVINWTDKLQSHVSVGKTLTRPEFSQLNPALSLIPPTVNAPGTGRAGNPYLDPTESINSDATLEYYFEKNGFAQIAFFHRDIDGYLQDFELAESINGQNYRVTRPRNSGKGMLRGAEFGIQRFFDFLPAPWNGFGAQFNYTYIDGENEAPVAFNSSAFTTSALTNVAKNSYNVALLYEGHGITGRLAATHRGKYVEQLAEPRFAQDRIVADTTYVDLSLGYELTRNLSVHFDAINLTKEKYESYLGDPRRPRDIRYSPAVYGISLRYKM